MTIAAPSLSRPRKREKEHWRRNAPSPAGPHLCTHLRRRASCAPSPPSGAERVRVRWGMLSAGHPIPVPSSPLVPARLGFREPSPPHLTPTLSAPRCGEGGLATADDVYADEPADRGEDTEGARG